MLQTRSPAELVTRPVTCPLTLEEAKKQLEIATSDDTHDSQLMLLIEQARDQWEGDTDSATVDTTWRIKTDSLEDGMRLPKTPVTSISSITYYDSANALQTLATSVYGLDVARQQIRLKYSQVWPAIADRWDAVTITYVCGYGEDGTYVPGVAKRAMLLLIGYYFENRDMLANEIVYNRSAYESLVARFIRSSYP